MPLFSPSGLTGSDAERYPGLQTLIAEAYSLAGSDFSCFQEAVIRFFESGFFINFLKFELSNLAVNPEYSKFSSESNIEIIRFPEFSVQLGRLKRLGSVELEGTELSSYATDIMYYNLGPQTLPYEIYRVPDRQINDVFDRTCVPEFVDFRLLNPGEHMALVGGRDIFKILPFDHDTFQAVVISRKARSLEWHYDYETLKPLYASAGNNNSSVIQHAIKILVKLGSAKSAPTIARAYGSQDHFVRWSAVRAALALDEDVGIQLLQRAMMDPHPHVRAAAAKVVIR